MAKQNASQNPVLRTLREHRIFVLSLLLLLGLGYVAIPQLGFFDSSWTVLLSTDWRLFGLAVVCLLVSYLAASFMYMLLTPKKLRLGRTYIVQMAGSFAGRVLPAGIGSISVSYLYLRKQGNPQGTAGTVVATNNILGFVGHGIWLLIVLVVSDGLVVSRGNFQIEWMLVVILLAVGAVISLLWLLRKRITRIVREITRQLSTYKNQPANLPLALLASMLLTACNIAIIWLAAQSLAVPLSIGAAAVGLTLGVLAQTVTPTPGGLGGVEAGLAGGLVIAGLPLENAVAVTLLFRFVTFWIPLALGGLALVVAIRQKSL